MNWLIFSQLIDYLLLYGFVSFFPVYLITSIYKKELPIFVLYTHGRGRNLDYKGRKAIFVSIVFIFLYLLFLPGLFGMKTFNLLLFLLSFPIGISFAFILHNYLQKYFTNNPESVIPNKIPSRKLEISNLILWGIVGIFVGFIFGGLISLVLGVIFNFSSNFIDIIFICVFLITIILVALFGARTTWMR